MEDRRGDDLPAYAPAGAAHNEGQTRAIVEQQQLQIAQLRQDLATMHQTFAGQMSQVLAAIQAVGTTANSNVAPAAPAPGPAGAPADAPAATKKKMPELREFDGSRENYPEWRRSARTKLEFDGSLIGGDRAQLAYLWMRMEPKAQQTVGAYYDSIMQGEVQDPHAFIRYLDGVYLDPNAPRRALGKLQALRQAEGQSFASFLPRFERLLSESQMGGADDFVKLGYLEQTLNTSMREAVLSAEWSTYADYCQLLLTVGSRIDAIQGVRRATTKPTKAAPAPTRNTNGATGRGESGTSAAATGKEVGPVRTRARWVDRDELERRRTTGACVRCGRRGHLVRDCEFAPAERPVTARVAHVLVEPEDDQEGESGDEQGNAQL